MKFEVEKKKPWFGRNQLHKLTLYQRFWEKVDTGGDCWEWIAGRGSKGYGSFLLDGRPVEAHRAAYELAIGDIPSGMCVLHRCDNPPCVRPSHLFLGSRSDNVADMDQKGRRGRSLGNAKITPRDARWIRKAYAAKLGTQAEIGAVFSVSPSNVSLIVNGKAWA